MIEVIKDYITKRIELLKLEFTEKSALSAGIITFITIIAVAFSFFIILFNVAIAILIGEALGKIGYGFLIVAGFYLLVIVVVFFLKKIIVNFIANAVIEFLKK